MGSQDAGLKAGATEASMNGLIGFGVGVVLGVIAGRFYWNQAIRYAKARETLFQAWVASEFRRL